MTVTEALDHFLRNYAAPDVAHATRHTTATALSPKAARDRLARELRAIERRNERWFSLAAIMLLAVFIVGLVGIVLTLDRPAVLKLLVSGLGATTMGGVFFMARLWERKIRLEILLRLAINLQGDALTAAIEVLTNRLRARSVPPSADS